MLKIERLESQRISKSLEASKPNQSLLCTLISFLKKKFVLINSYLVFSIMIIITNEQQHAIVLFRISADCVYVLLTSYLWSFRVDANSLMVYSACLWYIKYVRVVVRVKQKFSTKLQLGWWNFHFPQICMCLELIFQLFSNYRWLNFVIFATICKVVSGLLQLTTFFLFLFLTL